MKIVNYPHPALRYRAKPVTSIDKELRLVIGQMLDLMYENKGLGLAAPQVALPFQVFVMNPSADATKREDECVYINPVILERKGGMVEAEEGCLSFPGLYQNVRRAKQIRVGAYDPKGEMFERELSDMPARIVQHETDHLHGILFIDKFGDIARLSSRGALADLERDYKKAQERKEIPSNKEIQRQLRELEKQQTAGAVML